MADGPIKRGSDPQLLNNVKGNAMARKRRGTMSKVDEMQSGRKMPKKKKRKKNPYEPGTARYKQWARKRAQS